MKYVQTPKDASGPVYQKKLHPELPFDRACSDCTLKCGGAVPGTGPLDLSKIKLIVIADYPGHYEKVHGFSQVPRPYAQQKEDEEAKARGRTIRRRKPFPKQNSGEYLRQAIQTTLKLDPYEHVFYTNAVRCPTEIGQTKINVTKTHLKACLPWLEIEMDVLDKYCPKAPILVGGTKALQAFNLLYGTKYKSVTDVYRTKLIKADEHPTIFTWNPAVFCKGKLSVITRAQFRDSVLTPVSVREWCVPGTPQWHFEQSLKTLIPYL